MNKKIGFGLRVPFLRNRTPPWRGGAPRCGVGATDMEAKTTSELSSTTTSTAS